MPPETAFVVMQIALWLLLFIVGLIIMYWVIRLAVTGAMRRHTEWVDAGKP